MMNMADRAEVMALLEQRDNSLLRNLTTQLDMRRHELVKEIFGQTCSTGANKVGTEQNVSSSVAPTRCGAKVDIGISGDNDAAGVGDPGRVGRGNRRNEQGMRYKVCAVRRKRGGSEARATFECAHECTGAEGEVQPKKKTKVLMGYDEQIKRAGDNLGTAEAPLPRSIRDNSLIVPWMIKSIGFFNNAVGSAVNVHIGYGYAGTSGMGHNKKALFKRTRVRKECNIKRQRKKRGVAEEPPFPFGRNRIQVIAEAAHEVYDWVMNCTSIELKREWIAHTRSSMETRIKGERLKAEMSIGGRIGNDVCSLIFRILEREDHELYKYQVVKRSRHFIPPEWGVQVLIQGDYLNSDKVKAMFIAAGLGYDPKDYELVRINN
ncbi:uncharacterized protein LOC133925622 [Phragmites australis]|uniref:uncharacterized protein LOC133925622 n=1 Tax=Phragmites australis TaxID=29695 RepID=UPI002D7938F5|nr:uncharacterized protein LOC133925622 [Phragmites australis]